MELGIGGQVAIVTGAAAGIGKAIALSLIEEGAKVVIADVDLQKAQHVADEIRCNKGECLVIRTNVSESADIEKLVSETIAKFGTIDIVVNNAGICSRTEFSSITEKEWDNMLAVNLKSVFFLCQKVLPHMQKKHYGRIINIASGAGKIGGVQVGAHYSASKAAVICLTKTLALLGAPYGITANAVCPGVITTEITMNLAPEKIEKYKKMIPLGRLGTAEDVAKAVLFLASSAADYITGEITDINGGFIID